MKNKRLVVTYSIFAVVTASLVGCHASSDDLDHPPRAASALQRRGVKGPGPGGAVVGPGGAALSGAQKNFGPAAPSGGQ